MKSRMVHIAITLGTIAAMAIAGGASIKGF